MDSTETFCIEPDPLITAHELSIQAGREVDGMTRGE